jgi:hypothetical protein
MNPIPICGWSLASTSCGILRNMRNIIIKNCLSSSTTIFFPFMFSVSEVIMEASTIFCWQCLCPSVFGPWYCATYQWWKMIFLTRPMFLILNIMWNGHSHMFLLVNNSMILLIGALKTCDGDVLSNLIATKSTKWKIQHVHLSQQKSKLSIVSILGREAYLGFYVGECPMLKKYWW